MANGDIGRRSQNGKVLNQEKVEFMKQIARDIGITFSEPDPNMPKSVACDLQLKLLESIIYLDSSNSSRTPRKKKARKYLKSSLESKESRKIDALQICPNLQDLADNISCLSVQELLSASEKLIQKNSTNCIQNYITGERKWLAKCFDEGLSAEEDILSFNRQALQRLYYFLLVPFPKYILSQPKVIASRSHYEIGSKRSAEIEAGEVTQQIARVKDQIFSSAYDDVCHRISIFEQANEGAAEFLNTIEQNENNECEDILEQNEHDLRSTEEDLLIQIKEILIILSKEGRLARRSIPVIYNLICKLRVEEGDVEKLDPHVISLLVSQLHILRVEGSGKSGKLRLAFNDFNN